MAANHRVRTLFTRLLSVGLDGLIQYAAVGVVLLIVGLIWAASKHLNAVLMNRVIGACIAAFLISLTSSLITLIRLGYRWLSARQLTTLPEKGFLDYKLDAETAILALPASMAKLTVVMKEVGSAMDRHTVALQRAKSTARQLKISEAAAHSLDRSSASMNRVGVKYAQNGSLLSSGLNGWSTWIKKTHPGKSGFMDFPQALRDFIPIISKSNSSLQTYITVMQNGKGASSVLNAAIDRHIGSLSAVYNTTTRIHAACCDTLKVIEELT